MYYIIHVHVQTVISQLINIDKSRDNCKHSNEHRRIAACH